MADRWDRGTLRSCFHARPLAVRPQARRPRIAPGGSWRSVRYLGLSCPGGAQVRFHNHPDVGGVLSVLHCACHCCLPRSRLFLNARERRPHEEIVEQVGDGWEAGLRAPIHVRYGSPSRCVMPVCVPDLLLPFNAKLTCCASLATHQV